MNNTRVILIIEDEIDIAELLSIFFETLGYKGKICSTYKDVVETLQETIPWAIFCDFLLPDARGDYIYKMLKTRDINLVKRFVLMTGTLIEGDIMDFINTENLLVLQKPFSIETLQDLISRLEKQTGE
ncbi:MAG: response regulator [Thermodesulfovibrionales bacterium]